MGDLTACQPGWFALFARVDDETGDPDEEPIACWLLLKPGHEPLIRPICALGGEMCDATLAGNFIGVIGPHDGSRHELSRKGLIAKMREARAKMLEAPAKERT